MKKSLKVFFNGAIVYLITAPFLFSQMQPGDIPLQQNNSMFEYKTELKLYDQHQNLLSHKVESSLKWYIPAAIDTLKADTIKPKTIKKFRMKKSPTKAVLLSAVIPGAGQFYNESYWKIPVIAGFVGYFGYEFFRNNNLYKDNRDLYFNSQTPENPEGDQNYKTLREFYRDQRDDFVWYFLIVYVVNMLDAYVDAHLFDFDVSEEKLSRFNDAGKTYRMTFNLKF